MSKSSDDIFPRKVLKSDFFHIFSHDKKVKKSNFIFRSIRYEFGLDMDRTCWELYFQK